MFNFLIINWSEIGDAIIQALRTLCGVLAGYIYDFIAILYNLFMIISKAEFLDNAFVTEIYRKVGLILGIFMVFKLSFSLIQSLVDPDKLTDKKNGVASIISRCVISIVLLGITPTIFKEAFTLQKLLTGADNSENVIYKLIIGKNVGRVEDFGVTLSGELFFSFFTDNDLPKLTGGNVYHESQEDLYTYDDFDNLKNTILNPDSNGNNVSFTTAVPYLAAVNGEGQYYIEFDIIFSLVVGAIVAWMLVLYCIQTGIRVIQLAYLQLIAPVPIFSYISDPDGAFNKWLKQCTTTYLDLFIRQAIIFFIVYLSTYILEQFNNVNSNLMLSTGLEEGSAEFTWVKIFLILGLLLFAKKVPDLLKDLFPNIMGGGAASLSFGLKAPKEVTKFAKGAATLGAGVAVGGIAGMASGLRHGEGWHKLIAAPGGFIRGALSAKTKGNVFDNAKKGMANVRTANAKAYQRHHDGSTFFGRMAPISAQRTADEYDRELALYDEYVSTSKIIDEELEKDASVQVAMNALQTLMDRASNGGPAATAFEISNAKQHIKDVKETVLQREMATKSNKNIAFAISNAETLRKKAVKEGYQGFSEFTNKSVDNYADDFLDSVKKIKAETKNIKEVSGSRNSDYKKAKANSQYKPK